jgi:hypothetical protein
VGILKGKEKILAATADNDAAFIWYIDCPDQWFSRRAFHLYAFLGVNICQEPS